MERIVRLEIDEMPLGLHHPGALDYIGRYVGAAALEPLLRFDDLRKAALPGVLVDGTSTKGGLRHRFRVGPHFRWSDGRALGAGDIAERLRQAQAKHPYWAHHLQWMDVIEGRGDTLAIDTRRPVRHLPALLCADELGPGWGHLWDSCAPSLGPYVLEHVDFYQSWLRFAPNPCSPGASERPHLEFVLRRDVSGVPDRFLRGAVDVTCSTMFPLSSLAEWSGRSEFHSGPAPIWMQVEFGAALDPALLRRDVRAQLSAALDRNALSAALCGGATSRQSVLATTRPPGARLRPRTASQRTVRSLQDGQSPVRLAFYDYYPNRIVAEFLQRCWAETLDLVVALESVPFGSPAGSGADMRLELRYPSFPDPIAELEAAMVMLARVGSPDKRIQVAKLAADYFYGAAGGANECLAALVDLLDEEVPVIPLVNLRHHWLMNSRIVGFDLPHLANFDYKNLRFRNENNEQDEASAATR